MQRGCSAGGLAVLREFGSAVALGCHMSYLIDTRDTRGVYFLFHKSLQLRIKIIMLLLLFLGKRGKNNRQKKPKKTFRGIFACT